VFEVNLGARRSSTDQLTSCSKREPLRISGADFLTDQTPFLTPNQQFIYSVVSVNRNIIRHNKYLVVVTVVVVLSVIVIVIVISLEHSTIVVGVFMFKYPIYSIFRHKV